jgi:hypothetical protein
VGWGGGGSVWGRAFGLGSLSASEVVLEVAWVPAGVITPVTAFDQKHNLVVETSFWKVFQLQCSLCYSSFALKSSAHSTMSVLLVEKIIVVLSPIL